MKLNLQNPHMNIFDELDQNIVAELQRNGRETNSAIAKKYGINEGTVRQRIKKLTDSGAIRISAQINPEKLDNYQLFTLGVNVRESRELKRVAERLSTLPEIQNVAIVSGRYDILLEIAVTSKKAFVEFLTESLSEIEGLAHTESFMLIKTYNKWL